MKRWWSGLDREIKLLFLVWLFFGITNGIHDTVFNNYWNDIFFISSKTRGYLEFPRELPGFLIAIISGILIFLGDVRMLGVAVFITTLGMFGESFYFWRGELQFNWVLWSMIIWSTGTHLFMPVSSSVSIKLSPKEKIGATLGIMNGAQTASYIIGCALIWVLMGWLKSGYDWIYRAAAFFGAIAVVCVFLMKAPRKSATEKLKFKLEFKKEYSLFYWLSILFGARKQVFLTFAPWVIVRIYGQPATVMATLLLIASVIGIFFKPWLGKMIDCVGERRIIMAESLIFFFVCLGYGFSGYLGLEEYTIYLVFACYIIDWLLSAVTMARTTYLHKQLVELSDLTPTLSMGISLDHLVAMSVPMLGGLLWEALGYESIFIAAAVIAILNLMIAGRIVSEENFTPNITQ
ncbi:MAG: MFS transporter [Bacteroidota bacterium]